MADIAENTINIIIGVVLVFLIISSLAGTILSAANNLSASGLPLATLFGASGIVLIIVMVGFLRKIVKLSSK